MSILKLSLRTQKEMLHPAHFYQHRLNLSCHFLFKRSSPAQKDAETEAPHTNMYLEASTMTHPTGKRFR